MKKKVKHHAKAAARIADAPTVTAACVLDSDDYGDGRPCRLVGELKTSVLTDGGHADELGSLREFQARIDVDLLDKPSALLLTLLSIDFEAASAKTISQVIERVPCDRKSLDKLSKLFAALRDGLARLKRAGVRTSLFIDPDAGAVQRSHDLGADAIELHTGTYAHHPKNEHTVRALVDAAEMGRSLGLAVHAGHGLTVRNVGPVAAIAAIEELNIGHSIVSRAIFVGLAQSIAEMRGAMVSGQREAR